MQCPSDQTQAPTGQDERHGPSDVVIQHSIVVTSLIVIEQNINMTNTDLLHQPVKGHKQ